MFKYFTLFQCGFEYTQGYCVADSMKLNISKTKFINLSSKIMICAKLKNYAILE